MSRIICQAIIGDPEDMEQVLARLKKLRVKAQVYKDFVYVDFASKKTDNINAVREIFKPIYSAEIKQID